MQWCTHVPSVASPCHPQLLDLPKEGMFCPKILYLGCLVGAAHHAWSICTPQMIHVEIPSVAVWGMQLMVHPCAKCGITLTSPAT